VEAVGGAEEGKVESREMYGGGAEMVREWCAGGHGGEEGENEKEKNGKKRGSRKL
jgi:hypothetical protein